MLNYQRVTLYNYQISCVSYYDFYTQLKKKLMDEQWNSARPCSEMLVDNGFPASKIIPKKKVPSGYLT